MRALGLGMAVLFLAVNTAAAAENLDITTIYENYLASAAAAKRCGGQDPGNNTDFLRNLMLVSISAVQKVKQRTNLPDEQIQAMFKRNSALIENGVGRYIDDKGCGDDRVGLLLKMYKMHCELNLSGTQ